VSLLWHTPNPDRTIAVAMRRCYSTKPIEEIETELEQKGAEYWKYLLTRALQDKSLDVIEHYYMELLVDELPEDDVARIANAFPFVRFLHLGGASWLVSMNARTLVEMWRDDRFSSSAKVIVDELRQKSASPVLVGVAFGE
jgi:hypothetical protein